MSNQTLLTTLLREWFSAAASTNTTLYLENPAFTAVVPATTPATYTNPNYDAMVTSFNKFCVDSSSVLFTVRGLVTLPDGSVVYDSSKTNTATAARNKTINENHNSRQVIMKAILGPQGQYQYEGKYSTSDGAFESYIATCIGGDGVTSLGCVRLSLIDK
jgi:hypothetical protein